MKVFFKLKSYRMFAMLLAILFVNVCNGNVFYADGSNDDSEGIDVDGSWNSNNPAKSNLESFLFVCKNPQYLTIQDCNPVNTITVRITLNDSGTTVFENVYPQGQTSFIVIPMNGWSAGSYTIELFGRENNGYLWGTFQVLP